MIGDVTVRDAGPKGLGVFALRAFAEGEFVFRRRNGPAFTAADIPSLSFDDQRHLTELDWDRFAVIHPPGCYLNHSCEPSAMRSGVKVFAWCPIAAGEEITIDYRLNAFDGNEWPCRCDAPSCTGTVVGSFFALPPATQEAYLPDAPWFIPREYRRRTHLKGSGVRVAGPVSPRQLRDIQCGGSSTAIGTILNRISLTP